MAALTLPTLITTIGNKVKNNQITVITRKIQKGTDLLNIDNGIGPYYGNTREFLTRLSEHMKISTICDSGDDMKNCFPSVVQTSEGEVDITKIKDGKSLGLSKDNYPDVAGVILADGTQMLVSWNKNCPISDPDTVSNDTQGNTYECLSGIIDLNGFKSPNKIASFSRENGKLTQISDIIPFNHASGLSEGGMPCLFNITSGENAGKCLTAPPNEYKPMSYNDCMANKSALGLDYCYGKNRPTEEKDYYAGAARACGGKSKIADQAALTQLAQKIYGPSYTISASGRTSISPAISADVILGAINNFGLNNVGTDSQPLVYLYSSESTFSSSESQIEPDTISYKYSVGERIFKTGYTTYNMYDIAKSQGDITQVLCVAD